MRSARLTITIFLFSVFGVCSATQEAPCAKQAEVAAHWPLDTSEEMVEGPTDWMLQMKSNNIKAVGIDAEFTWDDGLVKSVSISILSYYSSYSRKATRFRESGPYSDTFSEFLSSSVIPIITHQLGKLIPSKLMGSHLTRVRGHILVMLYDTPCLPIRVRVSELVDPDGGPLLEVIASHDIFRFNNLLEHGANANAHTQNGTTALMVASFEGDVAMVKSLLQYGARVNDQDVYGRTALHKVAERVDASQVIPLLLKAGADINAKIGPNAQQLAGATPLIIAASMGNVQGVRFLLDAGADRNALTWDRMTALDVARHPPILPKPEHAEVVRLLEAQPAGVRTNTP